MESGPEGGIEWRPEPAMGRAGRDGVVKRRGRLPGGTGGARAPDPPGDVHAVSATGASARIIACLGARWTMPHGGRDGS